MGRAWITAVGGLLAVAGCGRMLDIQPDQSPATGDGGSAGDAPADVFVVPGDGGLPGTACPPAGPCVLAAGLQDLGSIAVAGNSVYFTRHQTAGAILQVPTSGGPVTTFESPSDKPAGLYATPAALYWISEDVNSIARRTFGMMTEASTNGTLAPTAQIVGIGPETFWTIPGVGANNGTVRRSTMAVLDPGMDIAPSTTLPTALAVDSRYVYYASKTTSGHIFRVGHDGSGVTSSPMMFDDLGVIALSNVGIAAVTASTGVYRVSTVADAFFQNMWTLVSPNANAVAMVADDLTGTLYVLAAGGGLDVIADVSPATPTQMVIGGCSAGRGLAQDAMHVYLACQDSIVRLPK